MELLKNQRVKTFNYVIKIKLVEKTNIIIITLFDLIFIISKLDLFGV